MRTRIFPRRMPFRHRQTLLSRLTSAGGSRSPSWASSVWPKVLESAATMLGTGVVLGLAGYTYHKYYKWLILHKMERAFRPGDPALEVAGTSKSTEAESRHKHLR